MHLEERLLSVRSEFDLRFSDVVSNSQELKNLQKKMKEEYTSILAEINLKLATNPSVSVSLLLRRLLPSFLIHLLGFKKKKKNLQSELQPEAKVAVEAMIAAAVEKISATKVTSKPDSAHDKVENIDKLVV